MTSIKELRKPKILNMAIFDLVATLLIAHIVHYILWSNPLDITDKKKRTWIQYLSSLMIIYITFIGIGVIFHRIFKVQSALSAYIGFNEMPIR